MRARCDKRHCGRRAAAALRRERGFPAAIALSVTLACAACGGGSEPAPGRAEPAAPSASAQARETGAQLVQNGQFAAAIEPLRRATELEPDDSVTHALLGVAYRGTGRLPEAADAFAVAVELDPENERMALDLIVARSQAGDRAGAIEAARQATARMPDLAPAHAMLATILSQSQELDDLVLAPGSYRRAIEIEGSQPPLLQGLAAVYSILGMWNEAEQVFREAIAQDPLSALLQVQLGEALLRQDRYEEAIAAFDAALLADPFFGWSHLFRGEALLALDRTEEAVAAFDLAIEALPMEPGPLSAAAEAATQQGRSADAAALLERALSNGWRTPEVLTALARLSIQQGRADEAVALLEEIDSIAEAGEAEYLLGQALVMRGDVELGRARIAAFQERERESAERGAADFRAGLNVNTPLYLIRARVFMGEARFEDALEQLDTAVTANPLAADAWELLVEVHTVLGNTLQAADARTRLEALRR